MCARYWLNVLHVLKVALRSCNVSDVGGVAWLFIRSQNSKYLFAPDRTDGSEFFTARMIFRAEHRAIISSILAGSALACARAATLAPWLRWSNYGGSPNDLTASWKSAYVCVCSAVSPLILPSKVGISSCFLWNLRVAPWSE